MRATVATSSVNVWSVKRAVTLLMLSIVTVQGPVPVHAPDQLLNTAPVGSEPVQLMDNDVLELAGTAMRFQLRE